MRFVPHRTLHQNSHSLGGDTLQNIAVNKGICQAHNMGMLDMYTLVCTFDIKACIPVHVYTHT